VKENWRPGQWNVGALVLLPQCALDQVSRRCVGRLDPDRSALGGTRPVKDNRIVRGQHPAADHQNSGKQQRRQSYARLHSITRKQPVCR